jgi:hypothetical protein
MTGSNAGITIHRKPVDDNTRYIINQHDVIAIKFKCQGNIFHTSVMKNGGTQPLHGKRRME